MTTPIPEEIDPTPYVTVPKVDALGALALLAALLSNRPLHPTSAVSKALDQLGVANTALAAKIQALHGAGHRLSSRDADRHVDASWSAIYGRLTALALLSAWGVPGAARAGELLQQLFPQGIAWLNLPYASEWAASNSLITVIESGGLVSELDALIGEVFFAELKRAHKDYGIALGITETQPEPADTQVAEPLRLARKAIAGYALAVVVMGNEDESVRAAAVKALKPIDDARAAVATPAHAAATATPTPAPAPTPAPTP